MPRDGRRSRWAIEVVTVGDGVLRVDLTGLMDAYERATRRWARVRMAGAILCSLTVAGSLALGVMAIRWDVQHRREVQVLKFLLQETEAKVMCWNALANRWNVAREDIVPVAGREAWVRGCVEGELKRQEDGALRGGRPQAVSNPEQVNHHPPVQSADNR